jgi:hypothetical protein
VAAQLPRPLFGSRNPSRLRSISYLQIFGGETVRLYALALEWPSLLDNRLDIRAGRIGAVDEFLASLLCSAFVNSAFNRNPGSVPTNVPPSRSIPWRRGPPRAGHASRAMVCHGGPLLQCPHAGNPLDSAFPAEVTLLEPTLDTIAVPRDGPGRPRTNPGRPPRDWPEGRRLRALPLVGHHERDDTCLLI